MRHIRLLCVICVSLWSAAATAGQAEVPGVLSPELRDRVREERFAIVTSVRGLPLGVRDELEKLFGNRSLDIADSGAEFRLTNAANSSLPIRRLAASGCTIAYCLVYYERGGDAHTWHVALFHWTPKATSLEWGGTAPGGLASIEDVRNAVLSGAVTGASKVW